MLDRVRDTLADVTDDALAIARLEIEVGYLKLADYDRLARAHDSLRSAIATLERNVEDMASRLEERDRRIEKLRQEYKALQERKSGEVQASSRDDRLSLFKKLEPLATQLPTLHQSIQGGADVSTGDVLALLGPLDEWLADLGFKPIGRPGQQVPFDSTLHKAVGKGARVVQAGDPVTVRYVGYLHEGSVVTKAHVTAAQP